MKRAIGLPDMFSADELARVAGLPVRHIRALIRSTAIPTVDGSLVARHDAVRACRALVAGRLTAPGLPATALGATGNLHRGLLVSGSVHAAGLAMILVLAAVAVPDARPDSAPDAPSELVHLVFVADPGPGGGGGGGGRRQPAPPDAKRAGARPLGSPLPRRQPPKLTPPRPRPVPPRPAPLDHEPLPLLLAPLVAIGADTRDVPGRLAHARVPPAPDIRRRGSGTGGGVGDGAGVGVGQGRGRGVGPGEGGGTGGGPYRPGSGIDPPSLLHEVTPDYTEQARRAGLEGEVLLEIVVGSDGGVSDVRVLRRLGAGLDELAANAVRQWRFSPARRFGTPVAVVVEVAVEFTLR